MLSPRVLESARDHRGRAAAARRVLRGPHARVPDEDRLVADPRRVLPPRARGDRADPVRRGEHVRHGREARGEPSRGAGGRQRAPREPRARSSCRAIASSPRAAGSVSTADRSGARRSSCGSRARSRRRIRASRDRRAPSPRARRTSARAPPRRPAVASAVGSSTVAAQAITASGRISMASAGRCSIIAVRTSTRSRHPAAASRRAARSARSSRTGRPACISSATLVARPSAWSARSGTTQPISGWRS